MASTPKLPSDFVDLSAAFADAEVRYLVIGGYAVGFHDRPRATIDLDLLLADDADNVERTRRVSMEASDQTLPVASLDDLIKMKKAADRDQDRADLRRLERRQKKPR